MKKYLYIVVLFLLTAGCALAQSAGSTAPQLTETSVVKDSSGTILPYSVWKSLLVTGKYLVRPLTPGSNSSEFVLIRLSEEAQKKRMENAPKPRESPFFTTGKKPRGFTAKDMNGNKYKLKDLEGKVVVLNFWFVACGPCRMEIPELNKLTEEYKDSSNVVFLAVALDSYSEVAKFLEKLPFNYNIVPDGRYISAIYSITAYPTHAILDKSGTVIFHSAGYGAATVPWLRKSIAKALQ